MHRSILSCGNRHNQTQLVLKAYQKTGITSTLSTLSNIRSRSSKLGPTWGQYLAQGQFDMQTTNLWINKQPALPCEKRDLRCKLKVAGTDIIRHIIWLA